VRQVLTKKQKEFMSIYLDSAIAEEVEAVKSLGWVRGVTTNPVLLAKVGCDVQAVLTELACLNMGSLFYQLVSPTLDGMVAEMQLAINIAGSALVLKVPPTKAGFQFAGQCSEFPCCVTAIYNPSQALIASEVKARFVAVYVNRATRLMGDGLKLVWDVAEILKHSETEIIAASVKSAEEACAALSAGAHHLTLPYDVLMSLMAHPLTEQTVAEFQAAGLGLTSSKEERISHFHEKTRQGS
jgi:transaldolase